MAGTYRYLAYDLRTNTSLGELPLSEVSFGGQLNGIGDFKASLTLKSETATLLSANTVPEKTIVYVERDGVILDGYIIWTRIRRGASPVVELAGASVASFFRRNRLVTDLAYTATDQFTIAQAFINALQAQTGGNIGITVGSNTCGVTRARTYYAYERKNVYDALAQLGAVNGGFDWAIDIAHGVSAPEKTLTLSYPRRGRIASANSIILELGKNIDDYHFLEDGTRSARTVDIIASGDGADMRISTATRTDLLDLGYPLTAESIAMKDVSEQATADAYAISAVNARAETPTFLKVMIRADDIDGGLGHWIVGDDVQVRMSDLNFPVQSGGDPGYEEYHRIVEYNVMIDVNGKETVNVTLGQLGSS